MAASHSLPSLDDWALFFASFTHLTQLHLEGLDGRGGLWAEGFCRRVFPYLAASLEELEMRWVEVEEEEEEGGGGGAGGGGGWGWGGGGAGVGGGGWGTEERGEKGGGGW